MTKNLLFYLLMLFLVIACTKKQSMQSDYVRVDSLIKEVKKQSNYSDTVQSNLHNVFQLLDGKPNDTLKRYYMLKLSDQYYNFGLQKEYFDACQLNLELAQKANDSLRIGIVYYDLADYYRGKSVNDTAYIFYNKALNFLAKNNFDKIGRTILNKAYLLRFENNLVESEIQTVKALEAAKKSNNERLVYDCYNNLGIVNNEIKNYNEALAYHQQALSQLDKLKSDSQYSVLIAQTKNNLAVCYRRLGNYKEAIRLLEEGSTIKNLKEESLLLYAVLNDNLSYTKLLSNQEVNVEEFELALTIRDSLGNKLGVIESLTHIGEYHLLQKDTAKSIQYFQKAVGIAKEVKSHRDELLLLNFLADAQPTKRLYYKEQYIQLSDSLMEAERAIRNKFTRIEYETDEIIQEKELLVRQQQLLIIISLAIIALVVLTYIIFRQKAKQKELLMLQEQQKSNEEVYQMMIHQNQKVGEGRSMEKNRISLDLHDGVLSTLAAIRLNLYTLNSNTDPTTIQKCLYYVDELKTVEKEIRTIAHDLKSDVFAQKESFLLILETFIEEQNSFSKSQCHLEIDSEIKWEKLPQNIKINCYRIIQEAVYNSQKYAEAKHIIISFKLNESTLKLSILDDGVGFDADKKKKGIGLENMKMRVNTMSGTIKILSDAQKGTQIYCKIPLHYEHQNTNDR
jgi:signal transduction histidine kinase